MGNEPTPRRRQVPLDEQPACLRAATWYFSHPDRDTYTTRHEMAGPEGGRSSLSSVEAFAMLEELAAAHGHNEEDDASWPIRMPAGRAEPGA